MCKSSGKAGSELSFNRLPIKPESSPAHPSQPHPMAVSSHLLLSILCLLKGESAMFLSRGLRKESVQDPGIASAGSQQLL